MSNRELIEYFWDEQESVSHFVYEDDRTGELEEYSKISMLETPEVTEDLKANYFANLQFWLKTQPLYD